MYRIGRDLSDSYVGSDMTSLLKEGSKEWYRSITRMEREIGTRNGEGAMGFTTDLLRCTGMRSS
eukprot:c29871_g1_i1 orf=2-190(-)